MSNGDMDKKAGIAEIEPSHLVLFTEEYGELTKSCRVAGNKISLD